jgi:radical SAM protein
MFGEGDAPAAARAAAGRSVEEPAEGSGAEDARPDFARSPFIVIWELTRACALACIHCRAEAIAKRHPDELTTEEGFRLIDEVAAFGRPLPLLVFTGGDPLRRPDAFDLVRYAAERGFRVALTPSGTAAVTRDKLAALQAAGLARLAVSLDGSTPEIHDAFRGVRGSFRWTRRILEGARDIGLPLQVNTTVTRHNLHDLPAIAALLEEIGIVLWAVFSLVPTGRGRTEAQISAAEYETLLNDLYDLSRRVEFDIKTTEAPHFRRVILERMRGIRRDGRPPGPPPARAGEGASASTAGPRPPSPAGGRRDGIGRAMRGVNDGNGFAFIDHLGEVYPSGFLPLGCGNVRREGLVTIYRDHPVFRRLRDPDRLTGKCGRCEYRARCGGSRARAYALTGDYLASDPCCAYEPGAAVPDSPPTQGDVAL